MLFINRSLIGDGLFCQRILKSIIDKSDEICRICRGASIMFHAKVPLQFEDSFVDKDPVMCEGIFGAEYKGSQIYFSTFTVSLCVYVWASVRLVLFSAFLSFASYLRFKQSINSGWQHLWYLSSNIDGSGKWRHIIQLTWLRVVCYTMPRSGWSPRSVQLKERLFVWYDKVCCQG